MEINLFNNKIVRSDFKEIYKSLNKSKFKKNSVILITGCGGFLGYYLVNFFLIYSENLNIKKVIGIENKLTKKHWLNQTKKKFKEKFKLLNLDISNDKDIIKVEKIKFNYIIHAASIASPTFYRKFPIQTIKANVLGLIKLLDISVRNKIKSFLFFSSSEIYGDPDRHNIPTKESYNGNVNILGPRACYDESKRIGETICYNYFNEYKLNIKIVRPFNNFGPGMSIYDKRLPADLANAVIKNKNISLFSDGKSTRTFCYISDAISGYIKAILHEGFDCFNIGNNTKELTVEDYSKIFLKKGKLLFGYNKKIQYKKNRDKNYIVDNPSRRKPDISRANKILRYNPSVSTAEGVERYLRYLIQ